MPRHPRIDYPGATHHVTNRGSQQDIYHDDADRELFLEHLTSAVRDCDIQVLSFALMTNHYHLLLKSADAKLSEAMQLVAGRYTQDFNSKYGLDGALFKGRFFSKLIEDETYILEAARYVPNNPVKAGLVERAEDYRWSSHAATLGLVAVPEFLTPFAIRDQYFDGDTAAFDRFVRERGTRRSELYAHVADAWRPDQLLSEAINAVDSASQLIMACPLRSPAFLTTRDLLVDFVGDALGIGILEIASPRCQVEQHGRLLLMTLLHQHGISTIRDLATAFRMTHSTSAHRSIRRFETLAATNTELGAILDAGLRLADRAA